MKTMVMVLLTGCFSAQTFADGFQISPDDQPLIQTVQSLSSNDLKLDMEGCRSQTQNHPIQAQVPLVQAGIDLPPSQFCQKNLGDQARITKYLKVHESILHAWAIPYFNPAPSQTVRDAVQASEQSYLDAFNTLQAAQKQLCNEKASLKAVPASGLLQGDLTCEQLESTWTTAKNASNQALNYSNDVRAKWAAAVQEFLPEIKAANEKAASVISAEGNSQLAQQLQQEYTNTTANWIDAVLYDPTAPVEILTDPSRPESRDSTNSDTILGLAENAFQEERGMYDDGAYKSYDNDYGFSVNAKSYYQCLAPFLVGQGCLK